VVIPGQGFDRTRLIAWALVAIASSLFALQLAMDERAQAKGQGKASLREIRRLAGLAPIVGYTRRSRQGDPSSSHDLTMALPQDLIRHLDEEGKPLVFVDGVNIAFSKRRPPNDEDPHAYYRTATKGPPKLVIQCGSFPCNEALAVLRTPAFETALLESRVLERPWALLGRLGLLSVFVVAAYCSVGRWRADLVPPALLGVAACGLWWRFDIAGTSSSIPLLSAELVSAGLPFIWTCAKVSGSKVRRSSQGETDSAPAASPYTRLHLGRGHALLVVMGLALLVFGALAAGVFHTYLSRPARNNDTWVHLLNARRFVTDGILPAQFLFHLSVSLLAGLSSDMGRLTAAAQMILTCAVLAKLVLSSTLARDLLSSTGVALRPGALVAVLTASFFVAPLPNWWKFPEIYLGQISPTIWHSPTTVFLIPFAVAVFWVFIRSTQLSPSSALAMSVLLPLSALAKPNFALAFLPALGLLFLAGRISLRMLGVCVGATPIVLAWQAWGYQHQDLGSATAPSVSVEPLAIWRLFSANPAASVLLSFAFPLAVVAWRGRMRLGRAVLTVWLVTVVALLEFAILGERGPLRTHANFLWGTVPATHLLFVVSICELLARVPATTTAERVHRSVCWTLLSLHVASGIIFYWRSLEGLGAWA